MCVHVCALDAGRGVESGVCARVCVCLRRAPWSYRDTRVCTCVLSL